MAIERREFLKRAGLLGGALAAASVLPGCRWLYPAGYEPGPSLLDGLASDAPIDTVVVVMMENRSFDHWLGWLSSHEAYLEAGRSRYGPNFGIEANQRQTYLGPDGPVDTRHIFGWNQITNPYRGCEFEDPGHSWDAGRAQRDGGFLAPGANNDELAIGYYEAPDLPFTARLTKRFTTFDRYHCSLLAPTYPNREYLHSAQSGGIKTNYLPIAEGGFAWETIWDRFTAAGVPARYYYSDLPVLALFQRTAPFLHPIADYYTDCAAGTLPNVVFLDPKFLGTDQSDDHPLGDIRAGQGFLRDVFSAFARSPQWQRGVFIVTYDEWGGFFEHVSPVRLPDDRASAVDADDFSQAGFRVPTVMASPFARPGFVDGRIYDHTSILRFLEWRFLGAPAEGPGQPGDSWFLTARDRNAANIGASLMASTFSPDLWFDPAALDVGQVSPPCLGDAGGSLSTMEASRLGSPDLAFDEAQWATYLDVLKLPSP